MRIAKFSDLENINKIIEKAKASLKNDGVDQWQKGSPDTVLLAREISRSRAYVYELDGEIVAFAYLSEDFEPTYTSVMKDSKANNPITVHTFCVDSNLGKKGIATRFFGEIIEFAESENRDAIRIDTHEDNFKMRGLIEKLGFSYLGIIYIDDNGTIMPRFAYELLLWLMTDKEK